MKKKNTLYFNFLGFFTKKGKKPIAKNLLDTSFFLASKQTGYSLQNLLTIIFLKLQCFVEVKKIRIRRSTYLVPFSINYKRRLYLIIKFLINAVKQDTRRVPFNEKLSQELISIITNKGSKALKAKEFNISQALSNRSNAHFRW